MPLINKVISAISRGERENAQRILLESVRPAFTQWLASINEFIDYQ